ncbi:MAG: methyltransferase [Chloroflexi bacterium]|nr:methyltransferase [Chloroflexota bacterium]
MVEAGVFPPALFGSSALLAGYLAEVPLAGARRALDLGTGCGLCALALARRGLAVVATDINPRALACARENAARLGLGARVAFRLGSVFEPVAGERFDLICSNPPFYRGQPADPLDAAWRSPDFLDQLAVGLGAHLAPGGRAYLVLSSDLGLPAYRQQLASANLGMREVKRTGLVGERLVVWEVARR